MSSSRKYYDALADSYQEVSNSRFQYLAAIDQRVASSISLSKPKKLLDIGSGDGRRILKLTESTNVEVWALENSSEMCAILSRAIGASRIFEIDISCLSDIDETFESITALWNIFGHIEFIDNSFVDIKQKMKPGGVFLFDVNNPMNVAEYGIISSMRNWWIIKVRRESLSFTLERNGANTDVYFRSLSYYKSQLKRAGFSRIKVKFINYTSGAETNRFRGQFYFECS